MKREAAKCINDWLNHGKEALLVTGARQIGKTYLIRECLREEKVPFVEINFIEQQDLIRMFDEAKDAKDLLFRLSAVSGKPLKKHETVFFLDEIQECSDLVTKIKFLVDEGSYRYILSGSLLGIELKNLRSAPVGYLRILDMYPLNFAEFIRALGVHEETIGHLRECYLNVTPVDDFIHGRMLDLLYLYLIIGGMPRAVQVYMDTNDDPQKILDLIKSAQQNEPDNASLAYAEGNVYKGLGDIESAVKCYEKSLEIDPNYIFGIFSIGGAYFDEAVAIQQEMDATDISEVEKYDALLQEQEKYLEMAIEPLEKTFAMATDADIELKNLVASYLKQIYFRFRTRDAKYAEKAQQYEQYLQEAGVEE